MGPDVVQISGSLQGSSGWIVLGKVATTDTYIYTSANNTPRLDSIRPGMSDGCLITQQNDGNRRYICPSHNSHCTWLLSSLTRIATKTPDERNYLYVAVA